MTLQRSVYFFLPPLDLILCRVLPNGMGVTDRALRYITFLAMTYVALIFTTGTTGFRVTVSTSCLPPRQVKNIAVVSH